VNHATCSSATSCGPATREALAAKAFDLRDIKAPIVLFASMGDNITPPQQAFNWIADVYGSTEEIKARGQVIVGDAREHRAPRHLRVRQGGEEGACQIVSVLKSIEGAATLAYMEWRSTNAKVETGRSRYEVQFREHRLEGNRRAAQLFRSGPTRSRSRRSPRSRVQPARLRAVSAATDPVDVERIHREGTPPVPSAALSTLGVVGSQSMARVARPDRGARQDPARGNPS
jgi:hypothetical protein